jgi:hypothetical protein
MRRGVHGVGVPFILLTPETDCEIRNMAAKMGRRRCAEQAGTQAIAVGSCWAGPFDFTLV